MAFQPLFEVSAVPLGEGRAKDVDEERTVAVFHLADGWFAIDDTCSHAQASLSEGEVVGHTVICPRHGGRFDLTTGRPAGLPATAKVASYPVQLADGQILVDLGG
ncbi:MAG: Rieske (2Fe-2S) protein [Sulfobacillus sp.]